MTTEQLKELYATGEWIFVWKNENNKWVIRQLFEHCLDDEYKLIHIKHKEVLDHVLNGGKVQAYGENGTWFEEDFFDDYHESIRYEIIKDKPDLMLEAQEQSVAKIWNTPENDVWDKLYNKPSLNGHYCLATKEHYDKLIEDGYEDEFMYSTGDNYYATTGNVFVSTENIPENKTPMHLHNNEWVFDILKPIAVKIGNEEGCATQEFIDDHSADELAHITGNLEHEKCEHKNTRPHNVFGAVVCNDCGYVHQGKPKPVERITREDMNKARNCGDMKLIQDYAYQLLEYLEANQKEK